MVSFCWRTRVDDEGTRFHDDSNDEIDGLLWSKDLGLHDHGQLSMAVIQANSTVEDQSQLESGPLRLSSSDPRATFVGVYDGHGGADASRFVNNHLFCNIKRLASANQGISEDVIRQAFEATEEAFLSLVEKTWLEKPEMASSGTCCLVGIIADGYLRIANLGDSRVVLGRAEKGSKDMAVIQLSTDQNARFESVRKELREAHPQDPGILELKHRVWRVKGLVKVPGSIGDAYLKKAEFNRAPLLPKFRLNEPFDEPILRSQPSISAHKIHPEDRFLIFASDGLWDHLSNERAVDVVRRYPRKGIARRLVKAALGEAAKKREVRYSDLKLIGSGVRRHFHDDITVIVVFLDAHPVDGGFLDSSLSIRGGEGLP